MCAPLQTAHGALGVINLARYSPADDFSEAELTKLTDSLGPFALQVDELWREERAMRSYDALEVADRDPRRTLVPEGASEFGNWQIALARRPGWDLGGDLCDRAPHANGTNTMFVADVSGRGALAAQSASLTQGLFVGAAAAQRSASGLVSQMNAGLQPRAGEGRYVSLWLAQLSRKGEVTYCNAGYPPPLWVPGDGSEVRRLERGGPVIGMLPQTRYEEETLQLLPGDLLIVASDAVIGARDADEEAFGDYLLAETLQKLRHQPLDRVTKSLMEAALSFSGRSSPSDDLVVLAICYQPER